MSFPDFPVVFIRSLLSLLFLWRIISQLHYHFLIALAITICTRFIMLHTTTSLYLLVGLCSSTLWWCLPVLFCLKRSCHCCYFLGIFVISIDIPVLISSVTCTMCIIERWFTYPSSRVIFYILWSSRTIPTSRNIYLSLEIIIRRAFIRVCLGVPLVRHVQGFQR